jgi:hypothetical protein
MIVREYTEGDWARKRGDAGMQFNAVAESNQAAIRLYERLGFRIVGTVPGAFAQPALGSFSGDEARLSTTIARQKEKRAPDCP